jgi:hypothetical protein
LFVAACDEKVTEPKVIALRQRDAAVVIPKTDGGARVVPPATCTGPCCPKAAECYPQGDAGKYSGPECLAQRDNTGQDHWQLRQPMSISTKPSGNAQAAIAELLLQRSELKWPLCNSPNGASGFIQLVDLDRSNDTARVGFAKWAPDEPTAIKNGLCFVEDTYDDPMRRITNSATPPNWPAGLPTPLALPWKMSVVNAFRTQEDFDVTTPAGRAQALARFDPQNGDLAKQNFNGLFYLDEKTGFMHGYSPLTYIVLYGSQKVFNAIPIRESEIKSQVNDPQHPNCAGIYLGDDSSLLPSCEGNPSTPAWGCPPNTCTPDQLTPTQVTGYFLVTEMEQIYVNDLGQTLCKFLPGSYPNWTLQTKCSDDPKWNPADPVNGLPPGDWCAETNSVATSDCHDAIQSISFSTFQAFPIQSGTCSAI